MAEPVSPHEHYQRAENLLAWLEDEVKTGGGDAGTVALTSTRANLHLMFAGVPYEVYDHAHKVWARREGIGSRANGT